MKSLKIHFALKYWYEVEDKELQKKIIFNTLKTIQYN